MEPRVVTIDFHGDTLVAVETNDGVLVAVTPICTALGLAANKQRERIQNDPILREGITVTTFPSAGGMQETFCLLLDFVHGWLFTIDHDRVDPEARDKVLAYKRECYRVLFEHFYSHRTRQAEAAELEPALPKARPFNLAESFKVIADGEHWLYSLKFDDSLQVFIRPLCEAFGIDWRHQVNLLAGHPVLRTGLQVLDATTPGGRLLAPVLRVDMLQSWLLSIDDRLVTDKDAQKRLAEYRLVLADVLIRNFLDDDERDDSYDEPGLQRTVVKLKAVQEARATFGEAAAQAMWRRVGLPAVPGSRRKH